MTINERIAQLENQIIELNRKLFDLSKNTEETFKTPHTIVGGTRDQSLFRPLDARAGRGQMLGGIIIWNDTEISNALKIQPSAPSIGYNAHSHSRFSGGALIKDVLEIVEYDWTRAEDGTSLSITNKHSQQFYPKQPAIATEKNSDNEQVEKIGQLDLVFNPDTQTWGTAAYEIDVKRCNLVLKDKNGNILYSSPLYVEDEEGKQDVAQSSVLWDKNGRNGQGCWRFLAVYSPEE